MKTIDYYYNAATFGVGNLYLRAEEDLLQQGEEAVNLLKQVQQNEAPPLTKLLIKVLLKRLEGEPSYQAVLDFLDKTEKETSVTVMGEPIPEWLADKLSQDFDITVAPLLGLYLVKLESIWPNWKTVGVTLYLGQLNSRIAADPLIEFLINTSSNQYRIFGIESLMAIGDQLVIEKLKARLAVIDQPRQILLKAIEQIQEKLQGALSEELDV